MDVPFELWDEAFEHKSFSLWHFSPQVKFLPLDILLEYLIEHVTIGLLDVEFVFYIEMGNFGLCNRLSLWCFVPWINHLPPNTGPLVGNLVLDTSWSVSLTYFSLFIVLNLFLYNYIYRNMIIILYSYLLFVLFQVSNTALFFPSTLVLSCTIDEVLILSIR